MSALSTHGHRTQARPARVARVRLRVRLDWIDGRGRAEGTHRDQDRWRDGRHGRQRPLVPDAVALPDARRPDRPAGATACRPRRGRSRRRAASVRVLRADHSQPHEPRRSQVDRPVEDRPRRTRAHEGGRRRDHRRRRDRQIADEDPRRDDAQARRAARSHQLRDTQGNVAAHGARSWVPRRHAHPPRADRESHRPHGGRAHHARYRRPVRIRRRGARPGRDQ